MAAGFNWKLPKETGTWDDLAFPIRLWEVARETGWFFAFQFYFAGGDNAGYIGVQPRPGEIMETRFSVFGSGTKVMDSERCHAGADGGPGVTCDGGRYNFTLREWHYLRVRRRPGTRVWEGVLHDPYRQPVAQLGAWELSHDGGIYTEGPGFLERYRGCACSQIPRAVVDFGGPQYWPTGIQNGAAFNPHHDAGCSGSSVNFVGEEWDDCVRIGYGWTGATCGGRTLPDGNVTDPSGVHVAVNVAVE